MLLPTIRERNLGNACPIYFALLIGVYVPCFKPYLIIIKLDYLVYCVATHSNLEVEALNVKIEFTDGNANVHNCPVSSV